MGVPGLAKALRKTAIIQQIGCTDSECNAIPGVVIDGPSLAYWIYTSLSLGFTRNGDLKARPSLQLITQMTLSFLEELEQHNVKILHIYFDGALPTWKRPTRFSRLRREHLTKLKLRRSSFHGLEVCQRHESPSGIQGLLEIDSTVHKPQNDAPLPFLVPHILESLRASRFCSRIEMVPDEADGWCAAFAQRHGALVLTNDSDLAFYDLHEGTLSPFGTLNLARCTTCDASAITTKILQTAKFTQKAGAQDIRRVAYELEQKDGIRFSHKNDQSKPGKSSTGPLPHHSDEFMAFCNRYRPIDLEQESELRKAIRPLDPRLAEVVVQIHHRDKEIVSILPSLLDDPNKTSAWNISKAIRDFVYSLLTHTHEPMQLRPVYEFIDKGQRDASPKAVSTFDIDECSAILERLLTLFELIQQQHKADHLTCWRSICWILVVQQLLASKDQYVGDLKSRLSMLWKPKGEVSMARWEQIHLQAQLEATYYAFRQLYQLLHYLEGQRLLDEIGELSKLKSAMEDFPTIQEMFATAHHQDCNVEFVLKFAKEMNSASCSDRTQ